MGGRAGERGGAGVSLSVTVDLSYASGAGRRARSR